MASIAVTPAVTPPGPDIAGAVSLIQKSAQDAVPLQQVELQASDGAGGFRAVPALVSRDHSGAPRLLSLGEYLQAMDALIQQRRLAMAPGPDRRAGSAVHQDLGSFIAHLARFKSEDTVVWADAAQRSLLGIFDYHPSGPAGAAKGPAARWCKHRAVYPCPLSDAWRAWGGEDGLLLSQEEFAALLDTRDRELTTGIFSGGSLDGRTAPPPADLLTLANSLEVFSHATAKKERDGQRTRLVFTEESGTSGAPVPAGFLIRIRVFEDATVRQLEVRLRVTVEQGKAKFAVRIHEAAEELKESFAAVCDQVREEVEVPVFVGRPEQ